MARKTKAEFAAEAEAYRARLEAEKASDYPIMLMTAIERSASVNYELTVKDAKFLVRDRNSNARWILSLTYTYDDYEVLEQMIWDIEHEEAEIAERERKYKAKQEALAKLTKEERELLGV